MTEPNQEAVEQLDRDFAQAVISRLTGYSGTGFRDGECDDHWLVQRLANHRRTASAQSTSGDVERVLREAAQQMVDAWAASDADGMEAAEANLRCALAGKPLTYALGPRQHSDSQRQWLERGTDRHD